MLRMFFIFILSFFVYRIFRAVIRIFKASKNAKRPQESKFTQTSKDDKKIKREDIIDVDFEEIESKEKDNS